MKTTLSALYALIQADNPGLTLPVTDVVFGTPTRVSAEEFALHGRNTKITMTATPTSPVPGSVEVFYDRLILGDYVKNSRGYNDVFVQHATTYSTMADVLSYLNTTYLTNLTASDVNGTDPVDLLYGNYLTIQPGNLGYDGNTYIEFPPAALVFGNVFTVVNIGAIYAGSNPVTQRFLNANNSVIGSNPYIDYSMLTVSGGTVLSAADSLAHAGADCSAVLTFNDITNYYTGSVTTYYNRISIATALGSLLATGHTYLLEAGMVSSSDLLDVVNARTGLGLVVGDIVVEALPALVGGTANYTLTMAPTSLHYTGSLALTLVAVLPDISTVVTTAVADLADQLHPMILGQRVWAQNLITDPNFQFLRVSAYDGTTTVPAKPLFTVSLASVNDSATKTAHGGREASATLTFHPASGCTGSLTFYYNRYNLNAINGGTAVLTTTPDITQLLTRDQFVGAVNTAAGTAFQNDLQEFINPKALCFVNQAGKIDFYFTAIPGSTWFYGQVEVIVSQGAGIVTAG